MVNIVLFLHEMSPPVKDDFVEPITGKPSPLLCMRARLDIVAAVGSKPGGSHQRSTAKSRNVVKQRGHSSKPQRRVRGLIETSERRLQGVFDHGGEPPHVTNDQRIAALLDKLGAHEGVELARYRLTNGSLVRATALSHAGGGVAGAPLQGPCARVRRMSCRSSADQY